MKRVIVVGAGSISREYALQHFGPPTNTRVVAIVDSNIDRAKELASDVGSAQAGAVVVAKGESWPGAPLLRKAVVPTAALDPEA